jgi:predicted transcriptional regulator YdeE
VGQFDLFIGGEIEKSGLEVFRLPAGTYGKISVKPKLGLLWGLAVGKAKRYFYAKWLPSSEYEAVNMEYELHTEKSVAKNPEIDLIFAVRRKQS